MSKSFNASSKTLFFYNLESYSRTNKILGPSVNKSSQKHFCQANPSFQLENLSEQPVSLDNQQPISILNEIDAQKSDPESTVLPKSRHHRRIDYTPSVDFSFETNLRSQSNPVLKLVKRFFKTLDYYS